MAFVSEIEVALGLGCVSFVCPASGYLSCPGFFLYLLFSWAESFSLYAGSDRAIFVSVRRDEFTPLKCVANFSYTSESYSLSNCSNFGPAVDGPRAGAYVPGTIENKTAQLINLPNSYVFQIKPIICSVTQRTQQVSKKKETMMK